MNDLLKDAVTVSEALDSFIKVADETRVALLANADIITRESDKLLKATQETEAKLSGATSELRKAITNIDQTIASAINRNLSDSVTAASKQITKSLESANATVDATASALEEASKNLMFKLFAFSCVGGFVGAGIAFLFFYFSIRR